MEMPLTKMGKREEEQDLGNEEWEVHFWTLILRYLLDTQVEILIKKLDIWVQEKGWG